MTKPENKIDHEDKNDTDCVVIGAGPAGLTAALEFIKCGHKPVVLEKDHIVGGIARTEKFKKFHFDMGGHRFFSKSDYVNKMWQNLLKDKFQLRPRLSRIYYKRKFFQYPPQLFNTLKGLGMFESLKVLGSYIRWQILPYRPVLTFEHWVTNAFGKHLFEIFFKTYTEKVWGIPCSELRAEWAVQRIKNLSLGTVLKNIIRKTGTKVTSLIDRFHYPIKGPGMMWEAAQREICDSGGKVHLNAGVVRVHRKGNQIDRVVYGNNSEEREISSRLFISSMPLPELIKRLDPPAPVEIQEAAAQLKHRDFLTVCLILDEAELFPDNWIYVHQPDVRVARIQNYKNWSRSMLADEEKSSLGLEYFCNQGDSLWKTDDAELVQLACQELDSIGLISDAKVLDGCVFRVPNAYPVYDSSYDRSMEIVKSYCDGLENLRTVGRNGLHRYNNMDHSMLSAYYAVRMLVFGEQHDLWSINAEQEYHEEETKSGNATGAGAKKH